MNAQLSDDFVGDILFELEVGGGVEALVQIFDQAMLTNEGVYNAGHSWREEGE